MSMVGRRSWTNLAGCAALCNALCACGGEGSSDDGPNDGAATGGTGSGGALGTTGGTGAAGTGGAASPSGEESVARVQVLRTLGAGNQTVVTATFDLEEAAAWDALGGASGSSCTTTAFGDCSLFTCTPSDPTTDPTIDPSTLPSLVRLEAGTLTVSGADGGFTSVGSPSGETKTYAFATSGDIVGEEALTVTATGGTIAAFTSAITIPLAPLLLGPSVPTSSAGRVDVSVSRSADLVLTWDARATGTTLELVSVLPAAAGTTTQLSCRFDTASGTGTIPQAALAPVPIGTEIHLFSSNQVDVETPQGTVAIVGGIETVSPDRASFPVLVLE